MRKLWAKKFQRAFDSADSQNRSEILGLLEENRAASILECGCSDGKLIIEVGEKVKTGKLWGIDINSTALQSAQKKGVNVLCVDLNNQLPIPDESFDVVLANQVIEHIFETDIFLKEVIEY